MLSADRADKGQLYQTSHAGVLHDQAIYNDNDHVRKIDLIPVSFDSLTITSAGDIISHTTKGYPRLEGGFLGVIRECDQNVPSWPHEYIFGLWQYGTRRRQGMRILTRGEVAALASRRGAQTNVAIEGRM